MTQDWIVHSAFPTTHWTLVSAAAGNEGGAAKRAALTQLLVSYLPALRSFLHFKMRLPPDSVDDLLQRFVVDKILERDLVSRANRERGRFRSYLAAALQRFVLNCARESTAEKRSPGTAMGIEGANEVADEDSPPSDEFDLVWARETVAQAVEHMKAHCHASGRLDVWGVFEARVLNPTLHDIEPVPYAEIVEQLGLASPATASNLLVTANRMFVRVLRGVIGRYEKTDAEIDGELQDLKNILSKPRSAGGKAVY